MEPFDPLPGQGVADARLARVAELLKLLPLFDDRIRDLDAQVLGVTTESEGARHLKNLVASLVESRAKSRRELKELQEETAAGGAEDLAAVQGMITAYLDMEPGPGRAPCRLRIKAYTRG